MRVLCCFLALLLSPGIVQAHALGVECSLKKDGTILVEAIFEDDLPAIKAQVQVLDSNEKVIASGATDARGLWKFPRPSAGKYQVIVDDGKGHRVETLITVPATGASASPDSDQQSKTISDGSTRDEFIGRNRWLKAAIGVGAIFLFSFAFLWTRRRRPTIASAPPASENTPQS